MENKNSLLEAIDIALSNNQLYPDKKGICIGYYKDSDEFDISLKNNRVIIENGYIDDFKKLCELSKKSNIEIKKRYIEEIKTIIAKLLQDNYLERIRINIKLEEETQEEEWNIAINTTFFTHGNIRKEIKYEITEISDKEYKNFMYKNLLDNSSKFGLYDDHRLIKPKSILITSKFGLYDDHRLIKPKSILINGIYKTLFISLSGKYIIATVDREHTIKYIYANNDSMKEDVNDTIKEEIKSIYNCINHMRLIKEEEIENKQKEKVLKKIKQEENIELILEDTENQVIIRSFKIIFNIKDIKWEYKKEKKDIHRKIKYKDNKKYVDFNKCKFFI